MPKAEAAVSGKKQKRKQKKQAQPKQRNPYDSETIRQAINEICSEGQAALTRTPQATRDNVDTLISALMRAMTEPGCEVRLTYKTTAEAMCAWSWLLAACKGKGLVNHEKCSAFDVELVNGSGIMFWTDENKPEKEKDG